MSLTGRPLLVVVGLLALAMPVLAVYGWRWRTLRLVRTIALVVCGQLLFSLAIGLEINRKQDFFTSWDDLLGAEGTKTQAAASGTLDRKAAADAANKHGHGIVMSLRIPGARSGLDLPALVYLPPQYSQKGWTHRRFPVVEALDGFPGTPERWTHTLHLPRILDAEIAAGRMAPTIVVMPTQQTNKWRDSECINAVGGDQFATYLTRDVQQVVRTKFRAALTRDGWGLIGYSTGGFCVNNLAFQPGYGYAAGAAMSGYFIPYQDRGTGNLFHGNVKARQASYPLWQLEHARHLPGISLYSACAKPDPEPCKEAHLFAAALRRHPGPVHLTQVEVNTGGHNMVTWRAIEGPAFDWLSAHLGPPLAVASVPGNIPRTPLPPKPSHSTGQPPGELAKPRPSTRSGTAGTPTRRSVVASPTA
ncbi:alpha/beta hydrolase [Actinocatenispora rupis]|uniref:Esterase n=1 Tax=Actinocatenispora rupis TaxID=519421 RepID=A0A8J3NBV3_9ACTN|nr:alpha/beta hydrolase-fold protein [Actinocatenispora rupis]GID09734.1 esterase [Actinocatenispora rupis]